LTRFRLLYSETCRKLVKSLHPDIKHPLKKEIEGLRINPHIGKPLIEELAGFHSLQFRRYRIIYRIDNDKRLIEIHFVGHRRDIYEEFRKLLKKH
jgi:mRNA interferase RelE/StbE